ncbi:MAG TPA: phenylalanine--tRNA ligase subunit alpha [Acidimicrobiia bacterium]|nr:phenylalanine--tRNA ligase subunit alpha [Acidimicrobiia bacterium]
MEASEITSQLDSARENAQSEISSITDSESLAALDTKYLGKVSVYSQAKKGTKDLPNEDKPIVGKALNVYREEMLAIIEAKSQELKEKENLVKYETERLDLTSGTHGRTRGHLHIVTQMKRELEDIFFGMGYTLSEGPEVETDWHNFQALNVPEAHPARAMQDTLYVDAGNEEQSVLRTHTSPVQIRTMMNHKPPIYTIATGRVYRNEAIDARHAAVFHQIEGLAVDTNITLRDLRGTIETFMKRFLGESARSRLIPSYFPFTEPSAEFGVSCPFCEQSGCRVCSHTGWIEVGGCGMVDPNVFKAVGYDPEEVTGFAFGFGMDRIAMLKYNLDEIRLIFDNDLRFLEQY